MAKLDYLIDFAYLKEQVDIPQNISNSDLEGKLSRAQEMLRMLLGDAFYRDLLSNYKAGTLSEAYTALYDPYVKQFLAWQAYQYFSVTANYNVTPGGYRVHTEANSVVASDIQMAIIIKDIKQQAQFYKDFMVSYLDEHATDYPLYNVSCGTSRTGNTFHISAVKNRHRHHGKHCGCGCNSINL